MRAFTRRAELTVSAALAILSLAGGVARAGSLPADGAAITPSTPASAICRGPAAQPGQRLHGPILRVDGGDTVCVALAPDPATWVLVKVATPAADRRALSAAAFARNATCVIAADGRGVCDIEGEQLADLVSGPAVAEASLGNR